MQALALFAGVLALKTLEIKDEEGKNVFPGGEAEAACNACFATMDQIERHLSEPFTDGVEGKTGFGKASTEAEKKRVAKLNKELQIQKALDPNRCKAMEGFDLGHVNGKNTWVRRPEDGNIPYPVNIGLNDWAKQELNDFCVSMLTEHEEIMEEMAVESSKDLGTRMCKNELKLCEDIKPKKEKKSAYDKTRERMKQAQTVFDDMDADKDGFVTRAELSHRVEKMKKTGQVKHEDDDSTDSFFAHCDKDGDDKVTFEEYKVMWQPVKGQKEQPDVQQQQPPRSAPKKKPSHIIDLEEHFDWSWLGPAIGGIASGAALCAGTMFLSKAR